MNDAQVQTDPCEVKECGAQTDDFEISSPSMHKFVKEKQTKLMAE